MKEPVPRPFRPIDERRFDAYVARKLKTVRYDATKNKDERDADIFRTSLFSAWEYLGGGRHARNREGKPFRFYPGFVDVFAPNAFADRRADTHFCGIHSSLAVAMHELSLFCACQQTFFPEVGDPSVEKSPDIPGGSGLSFLMIDMTKAGEGDRLRDLGEAFTPHDGERFLLAHLLTQMLLRFVWFHEFYHCVNGHVGFMKRLGYTASLNELPAGNSEFQISLSSADRIEIDIDGRTLHHCIEYDADRSALWAMVKIQVDQTENIRGMAALQIGLRIKITLFAAYLMTYFFDEHARRVDDICAPSHPSATSRLFNLVQTTASHVTVLYPDTLSAYADITAEFERMRPTMPNWLPVETSLSDPYSKTYEGMCDIEYKLNALRCELARFAFHASVD